MTIQHFRNDQGKLTIYKIGDIVPYKNTRGKIKFAQIDSFFASSTGDKEWFKGSDIETKAKVSYPVHLSMEYKKNLYYFGEIRTDKVMARIVADTEEEAERQLKWVYDKARTPQMPAWEEAHVKIFPIVPNVMF